MTNLSLFKDKHRSGLVPSSFDSMFEEIEKALNYDIWSVGKQTYPPYNIVLHDKDNYTVEVAVAGFDKSEILVYVEKGVLHIKGDKSKTEEDKDTKYLVKGIASRRFALSFSLAEDLVASHVEMSDGMLYVDLERIVPEEKKPKYLEIK